jgi:hypothetical protein
MLQPEDFAAVAAELALPPARYGTWRLLATRRARRHRECAPQRRRVSPTFFINNHRYGH